MRCAVYECRHCAVVHKQLCQQPSLPLAQGCPYVCYYADAVEPQQVVVQDDLDQLLDMLPADLGSLLINHPKRPQLIEVRPQALFFAATAFLTPIPESISNPVPGAQIPARCCLRCHPYSASAQQCKRLSYCVSTYHAAAGCAGPWQAP